MTVGGFLRDPALDALGVDHGFGTRGAEPPRGLARPRQVHGVVVSECDEEGGITPGEADAVVCRVPERPVAVVTADCVPILVASASGGAVAAIHAGWRGLAAGVIGEGLRRLSAATGEALSAAVGPHARACCYEVDAPVTGPLEARFGESLRESLRPSRPGHHWLELERLVVAELEAGGVAAERVGTSAAHCTVCDARRFESYRRDGAAAGRLVHWVSCRRAPNP